jgi:hypothetical protein
MYAAQLERVDEFNRMIPIVKTGLFYQKSGKRLKTAGPMPRSSS